MTKNRSKQKLMTIPCTILKDYSRLMGGNKLATLETLKQYRTINAKLVTD